MVKKTPKSKLNFFPPTKYQFLMFEKKRKNGNSIIEKNLKKRKGIYMKTMDGELNNVEEEIKIEKERLKKTAIDIIENFTKERRIDYKDLKRCFSDNSDLKFQQKRSQRLENNKKNKKDHHIER
ncbi:hypothetical protein TTHERM_00670100 (macronuclear) [Tetrahymena thermophila SB210]|uniref:Uncharacterized protein n=1 Tax=Tetrahymena thermophila (strain SB210) TaxID=312017 RepID=I7MAT0_TETTS|nr:hypothetical protein TTHERM_00670100 [Tetrahymena thermophila SB210]EAS06086.1 hypothetical protein TTHERM_00670100 [Tetrahymena thermophila SB210]|eukprot:XP_001026331.1 hypothetical protein TTHERM_00670100 [Tetrahymena thermophila SB210]